MAKYYTETLEQQAKLASEKSAVKKKTKYHQGLFTPKNPSKYRGDPDKIVYRSSWELKLMRFLDDNTNVIEWASEEFFIPYVNPFDKKVHRYFPDFIVKVKERDGKIKTLILEVKPEQQTKEPTRKRITRKYVTEVVTWGVNTAKWNAANEYCLDRGYEFRVVTEHDLGLD